MLRDGAGNLAVHATVTFTMIGVEKSEIDAAFPAHTGYYMTADI